MKQNINTGINYNNNKFFLLIIYKLKTLHCYAYIFNIY